ncbi:phage portal protein [Prescottella equi]
MGAIRDFFGFGQPVQTRAGEDGSAGGSSPLPGIVPPARSTLGIVTADEALKISAVSRSIDEINTMLSGLSIGVYDPAGIAIKPTAPRFPHIVRMPSLEVDYEELIQLTVNDFALHGEFFWLLTRDPATNRVVDVRVVTPNEVTVTLDKQTGRTTYGHAYGPIPRDRIIHKKHTAITGRARGCGPIQNGQADLRAALSLAKFQQQWFDGDRPPHGVLSSDQVLSPIVRDQILESWNEWLRSDTGKTALLSAGTTYQALALKPAEAQMLEVSDAIDRKIARLMGLPAFDLLVPGGTESRTYMNLEQSNLRFLTTTLQKYVNAIERAFTEIIPRGLTAKFDETGLLRLDATTQAAIDEKHVKNGIRSADEIRARDGLKPLPKPAKPTPAPAPAVDDPGKAGN